LLSTADVPAAARLARDVMIGPKSRRARRCGFFVCG
jgi:hypothetical protein